MKQGDTKADFLELGERVKECVAIVGSYDKLSEKTGIPKRTLTNYAMGINDLKITAATAIADAADVSLEWLATGEGLKSTMAEGLFTAVEIMPVTASAGGGAAPNDEAACGKFPLARQWLHQHNLNAADLFMVDGVGDSMEPTILNREKLLCSKAEHLLNGDGIFVFRQEGDVLVKRLQRVPGKIKVISDNDAYQPYDIPLNDGVDFKIIGKVLFKHSLMPV